MKLKQVNTDATAKKWYSTLELSLYDMDEHGAKT